jgi:hypothetical protein
LLFVPTECERFLQEERRENTKDKRRADRT